MAKLPDWPESIDTGAGITLIPGTLGVRLASGLRVDTGRAQAVMNTVPTRTSSET
jgi:hypothetical protein